MIAAVESRTRPAEEGESRRGAAVAMPDGCGWKWSHRSAQSMVGFIEAAVAPGAMVVTEARPVTPA